MSPLSRLFVRVCGVAARLAPACVPTLSLGAALGAQEWNDSRTLTLVRRATELRARQLADTGLSDYQAVAHGYVTFLAQLGEGFREPPRVVKADELALQVYWRAPNLSKQRIVGRRDTLLLPTDIQYHRDHLGIVQNNFPAIIRLGDGDEVSDVPHPLSPIGLQEYDFALADSLRLSIPGRVISVYEVRVRPRDDGQPRVIGALYLDRGDAQVVRMALSFTRAAFIDKQLEDLFIVLENGLVGTRFWLPRRQEIEIRRTATWLDYPVRGIIRGRWDIAEYQVNVGLPATLFAGPEIVYAPPEIQRQHTWQGTGILDSLPPEVRAATAEEIRRVQAETRALVRDQALRRARTSILAARGVSDLLHFNRVEGLAFGAGFSAQVGSGFGLAGRGRYGLEDQLAKWSGELRWESGRGASVRVFVQDDFRDVGDIQERSTLANSFGAQEFGSDFSDPYRVRAVGSGLGVAFGSARWTLDLAREIHAPLDVSAVPARGAFDPTVDAANATADRVSLRVDQSALAWRGFDTRGSAELRYASYGVDPADCSAPVGADCAEAGVLRASVIYEVERPLGSARVFSRTMGIASVWHNAAVAQDLAFLGGPITAPGYDFHSLAGDRAFSQRLEMQLAVPFVPISLGRFGRTPARARLAFYGTVAGRRLVPPDTPIAARSGAVLPADHPLRQGTTGLFPSAGLGLITLFDLLRLDVARGFRRPGGWHFNVDFSRSFWPIL